MSPFKALYGQECLTPLKWNDPITKVQTSQDMLDEMQYQTDLIRLEIKVAQDRQKSYADQKRTERSFDIGDMVFLKIIPKKSSLSLNKFGKLKQRYCGPYTVIDNINDQAYQLLLLKHLKVHNVFHVNLLKKYVPDPNHIFEDDQLQVTKEVINIQPEAILRMQVRILQNQTMNEYLIKWMGYPEDDATWERDETLLKDYPEFMAR